MASLEGRRDVMGILFYDVNGYDLSASFHISHQNAYDDPLDLTRRIDWHSEETGMAGSLLINRDLPLEDVFEKTILSALEQFFRLVEKYPEMQSTLSRLRKVRDQQEKKVS